MKASSVRFFLVVSPHPSWVWWGYAVIVSLGVWTLLQDPGGAEPMLASALLVQMFTASTGFCGQASRGHYDPLLTAGRSRASVAFAHAVASSLPGWAAWAALGTAQALLPPHPWPTAFTPRGLSALLLVSAVAWGLALRLPRFSGGAIWCGLLLAGLATREGFSRVFTEAAAGGPGTTVLEVARSIALHAAVPFLLLRKAPPPHWGEIVTAEFGVVAVVVAGAMAYLATRDYALAEE